MTKRKITRSGTYAVKSAESRSTWISGRKGSSGRSLTADDKRRAGELLREKRG